MISSVFPASRTENVLSFLGLRPDGRRNFEVVNENKRARSPEIQNLLRDPPRGMRDFKRFVPEIEPNAWSDRGAT